MTHKHGENHGTSIKEVNGMKRRKKDEKRVQNND